MPPSNKSTPSLELVFDNPDYIDTIRSFRAPKLMLGDETPLDYHEGIKGFRASASGQFSEQSLLSELKKVDATKIWVVDLRKESHGFLNGKPITWYGYRNHENLLVSDEEARKTEEAHLLYLRTALDAEVGIIQSKVSGEIKKLQRQSLKVKTVESEQQLVERLGFHYVRLPIVDRHPPTEHQVEGLVALSQSIPKDGWVHVHCRAGKGRATTMLVLYDIIQNGTEVPLNTILARHAFFGPKDLRKLPKSPEDVWKREPAVRRLHLINDFYAYRNSEEYPEQPFGAWRKKNC